MSAAYWPRSLYETREDRRQRDGRHESIIRRRRRRRLQPPTKIHVGKAADGGGAFGSNPKDGPATGDGLRADPATPAD